MKGGGVRRWVAQSLLLLALSLANDKGTTLADILVFSLADRHQFMDEFRDMPAKFGDLVPSDGFRVISCRDLGFGWTEWKCNVLC